MLGLLVGCQASLEVEPVSAPQPVDLHLGVTAPWSVAHRDSHAVVLQHAEGADGIRVQLRAYDGRLPGVTPLRSGKTLEIYEGGRRRPLVGASFVADSVELEVQGPDLVVRMSGPPLSTLTSHPQAPEDPALAWIRIRPRPEDWRLALRGLFELSWPVESEISQAETRWIVQGPWGSMILDEGAGASWHEAPERHWLTTLPSLDQHKPYPSLGITWVSP